MAKPIEELLTPNPEAARPRIYAYSIAMLESVLEVKSAQGERS